ncbi:toxin-antitoxin system HicB family antitoxin [Cellulomonas phragmiteti]|uniref:Histidine kinase n=1 Tax=Cellulomonas phragmiteti TaxID=478780 RepID=A0ABQ4DI92_9CELL|nr:toxin-antitoxin system HicB family antitoxin [Cellulomonas phragmiteti]GIG39058.1 hypothetical protein Cph01nite_08200 [Cellulomonas phragmiteti]
MDLTRYVDDLQERLTAAAAIGGDEARQLAQRLTTPLDAAVRLVLLDALTEAAGEISAELAPGSVDVRLRAGLPEFVVDAGARTDPTGTPAAPRPAVATPPSTLPAPDDEGTTTRTTLRLPDHLKAQVEVAAARDGVSVNSWLVRAVAGALEHPVGGRPDPQPRTDPRATNRLTGWVR